MNVPPNIFDLSRPKRRAFTQEMDRVFIQTIIASCVVENKKHTTLRAETIIYFLRKSLIRLKFVQIDSS